MKIEGLSIIGAKRGGCGGKTFPALNPATGEKLPAEFFRATAPGHRIAPRNFPRRPSKFFRNGAAQNVLPSCSESRNCWRQMSTPSSSAATWKPRCRCHDCKANSRALVFNCDFTARPLRRDFLPARELITLIPSASRNRNRICVRSCVRSARSWFLARAIFRWRIRLRAATPRPRLPPVVRSSSRHIRRIRELRKSSAH